MDSANASGAEGASGTGAKPDKATGRALIRLPAPPRREARPRWQASQGVIAAGVALVLGAGMVGGAALLVGKPAPAAPQKSLADSQLDMLRQVEGEVKLLRATVDGLKANPEARQAEEGVRALKRSVDALKGDLEGVKTASNGAVTQLSAKLDKLDRDPSPKLNEITNRLDKLADLPARIDRIERQVSAPAATGSIPPAAAAATPPAPPPKPAAVAVAPSPTGPLPPAKPPEQTARAEQPVKDAALAKPDPAQAKPQAVEGWLLRDVYDGVALVEGHAGLREISPGEYLPGVGEIRSIERRGRGWVVVTSRGLIQADNRW